MDAGRAWSFQDTADGHYEFIFHRQIPNCHAFTLASWQDEVGLNVGLWVVLWAAPWSTHSHMSLPVAIETMKKLDGKVQLGIHCYDGDLTVHDWCPLAEKEFRDPAWIFFRNGEFVGQEVGYMSEQQIINLISNLPPNS
jgi:hypothetical protein